MLFGKIQMMRNVCKKAKNLPISNSYGKLTVASSVISNPDSVGVIVR